MKPRTLFIGAVLLGFTTSPAFAQSLKPSLFERIPEIHYVDANEVDPLSGMLRLSLPLLSIGDGKRPMTLNLFVTSPTYDYLNFASTCSFCSPLPLGQHIAMSLDSLVSLSDDDELEDILDLSVGYTKAIKLPHQSARFSFRTASPFQSTVPDGSQLVSNGAPQSLDSGFTYTGKDGTQAVIGTAKISGQLGLVNSHYLVSEIVYPDGERWTYRYNVVNYPSSAEKISRLKSVVSSRGYALQFSYASNTLADPRVHLARDDWMAVVKATAYNKAHVACDETLLADCSSVSALPSSVQFTYNRANSTVDVAVPGAGTTRLTFERAPAYGHLQVRRVENLDVPGSARIITYYHQEQGEENAHHVLSVTKGGATWQYGYNGTAGLPQPGLFQRPLPDAYFSTLTVVDPLSQRVDVNGSLVRRRITGIVVGGKGVAQNFNSYRSPTSITLPEGNQFSITYDGRNNPTTVTQIPKAGSALPVLLTRAAYAASCTSLKRCNQPILTRDAKGRQTDYIYSTNHGGVLFETGPAVNGVRPEKRYGYAQRYAWVRNGAGSYQQSAHPIFVLTRLAYCRTSASTGTGCTAPGDEVVRTYEYGPNSGPNNLLLRGIAVTADGQTLRTCYSYDERGNKISETLPRAELTSCP